MRAKNILLIGAAFAAGFLLTKVTRRQEKPTAHLIEKAIYKGFAEIQNSKLALERSNSTNIKIFAQRMIEDHLALNQKLTDIATIKGIQVPNIEQHLDQVEPYLASYAGDDSFDEAYVDNQLRVHYEIVDLFKKIGTSDDQEINQFAAHAIEHLGHHLRMAQDLADTFHTNNIPTTSPYQEDFVEEPNYKTWDVVEIEVTNNFTFGNLKIIDVEHYREEQFMATQTQGPGIPPETTPPTPNPIDPPHPSPVPLPDPSPVPNPNPPSEPEQPIQPIDPVEPTHPVANF